MKSPTCEWPLKPVVQHRNKKWQAPERIDVDYHGLPMCGTHYRHCPEALTCVRTYDAGCWAYGCERVPGSNQSDPEPGPVLDLKVFEDIDLGTMSRQYRLVYDKGYLKLFKIPKTDRDLLIAFEREYVKVERTHIYGTIYNTLAQMLQARGYSTDIHDVRQRLW